MTEPQVWTIIAIMAASFFATMTIISTLFTRVIRSEVGGMRNEMLARFDAMNGRIDNLDRDVQFLMNREVER